MGTVFPFTTSEVGHQSGVPLGINKQTGVPVLFDNFHSSLTNYNMVIFAKSGAGKSVTMKTLISRSAVLMGVQSLQIYLQTLSQHCVSHHVHTSLGSSIASVPGPGD